MKYTDYVVIPKEIFDRMEKLLLDNNIGAFFRTVDKPLKPLIEDAFDAGIEYYKEEKTTREEYLNRELEL